MQHIHRVTVTQRLGLLGRGTLSTQPNNKKGTAAQYRNVGFGSITPRHKSHSH
jgi:hypothetical protein